jgi:hypothetical protein
MTVLELMELLKQMPQHLVVEVFDDANGIVYPLQFVDEDLSFGTAIITVNPTKEEDNE